MTDVKENYSRTAGVKRAVIIEIDRVEGEPVSLVFKPTRVEIDDNPAAKAMTIKANNASVLSLKGDVRSVFERIAPAEFPRLAALQGYNGRLWAVRLRRREKKNGHKLATYTSSKQLTYEASAGPIPDKLYLVSDSEVEELRELDPVLQDQFEIVEVSVSGDELEGQLAALNSEIDRLVGNMEGKDVEIEAFDKLASKSDLYIKMLRARADEVEEKIAGLGSALIRSQTKKADGRRQQKEA